MVAIPLPAVARHYAREFGADKLALRYPDGDLSWGELEARANQRAWLLRAQGVTSGDMVTLALPNGLAFHEWCFAIWKLGATPNTVASKLPSAEFAAILDLVNPAVVIGGKDHEGAWRRLDPGIDISSHSTEATDEPLPRNWKAMTSGGSTGRPKVIVDHATGVWETGKSPLDFRSGEVVLNPGPLYHNAPFICSHQALFSGCTVIGMSRFDAAEALHLIEKERVNWVNFVPTMMHRIWTLPDAERDQFDIRSLRKVWHMASAMPPWLKERWIEWIGAEKIFELYGGTEGTGFTVIDGVEWLQKKGSVGRLVGDGKIIVLDENGAECLPGEIGEIFLLPQTGPATTYHYLGAEAKRAKGGFETLGDIGYLDEDGYLFLADRRTDLILRGGANIYPAEIEAALDAGPGVGSSVVIGLPDEDLGQRAHAIVQIASGERGLEALHHFAAAQLARYKLPESYEVATEPLRDDAGKVRRSALRDERIAWLAEGRAFRWQPPKATG